MAEQINDLLKNITDDVQTIVKGEIALAKAEMMPKAKNLGIGGGLFAGAAVFGVLGLMHLMTAGGFAFASLYTDFSWGPALGFLTISLIFVLIAGILALIGLGRVKKATKNGLGPAATIEEANATVAETRAAITRGKVQADVADEARTARKEAEAWEGVDKL